MLLTDHQSYGNLISLIKWSKSFSKLVAISVRLFGCTTWTLTKHLKKILDWNYTKMLHAFLKKSWKQHPTKQLLYGYLSPISQIIRVRWSRLAGLYWRRKDKLISGILLWTTTHRYTSVGWTTKIYIYQFCVDTRCCEEDLLIVMTNCMPL